MRPDRQGSTAGLATQTGDPPLSVSRTLTVALATAVSLAGTALVAAPARAGGAPRFSTVTVDHLALLGGDTVTVHGTYVCTVPDPVTPTGPGTLGLELADRTGVVTSGEAGVVCDGLTRPWTLTAPAGSLRAGRTWLNGHVAVTDSAGNTPWNGFSAQVAVVRRG